MDFGPKEIGRILEITDGLNLHREAVVIPLAPEGEGSVRIVGGKLEIHRPEEGDFSDWIEGLTDQIRALPLEGLKKAE
jgi:hypothetical protein